MFSQYAFPNSFADNTNATTYSVSNVNATATPAIQSVAYQSSSDTSSGSSAVQTVTTQTITTQSAPIQTVSTQPSNTQPSTVQAIATQSIPVQTVQAVNNQTAPVQTIPVHSVSTPPFNTQPSTVQAVSSQSVPVQSVSTQSSSTPSVQVQASTNQSSYTWNRVNSQSHSSQTAPSAEVSNYTPSQPVTNNPISSPRGQIDQSTIQTRIHNWLSSYHFAYQSRPSNTQQYQRYVSPQNSPQYQQYVTSNVLQSTSITVMPSSTTSYYNDPVTFTATVTDSSTSQSDISGTLSWSDGNSGGTFSSTYCTLYSASCSVSYTPAVNSLSGVTITAYYAGDSAHQSSTGTAYLSVNLDHNTTTTIVANSATYSNEPDTFTATVTDPVGSPYAITGTLSWSDGDIGGTFHSTICTLYSASCSVTYTPPVNSPSTVTITANYSGDSTHRASSSSSYLSVNLIHSTTTTVTPNSVTYSTEPVSLSAVVSDPLSSSNAITGTLSWSDNGAAGTFSDTYCYTPTDCSTTYTPNVAYSGTVTITANYGGDNLHAASSGTTTMTPSSSVTPATYTTSSNIQTDKTSYNPGNTVTITVNPQGAQAGQNVAILVTDPLSNIVASRTVQTDAQGNSELQIGLLPTAQAGTYQISASALVNGNYLSYHATFSVTSQVSQVSGLSIISASANRPDGRQDCNII